MAWPTAPPVLGGLTYAPGMRKLALLSLFAVAACNTPSSGANERIEFTPTECGQAGGCDFDDAIGVYGTISVTIDSLDGTPTAGLDLASRDPSIMSVTPRADIGGEPAWDVTALGPGVAELAALDAGGNEIDFIQVDLVDPVALTMVPFVGDIVGPNPEAGYDEAFTIQAGDLVSWFVRPLVAADVTTMGRFSFETVLDAGGPDLTLYEASNSDRPNGYLYLDATLPPGDYPVRFELTEDGAIGVEAIVHALPGQ